MRGSKITLSELIAIRIKSADKIMRNHLRRAALDHMSFNEVNQLAILE